MHYWADSQSVHGFRCCDNIAPNAKGKRVFVLEVCLVCLAAKVHLQQNDEVSS